MTGDQTYISELSSDDSKIVGYTRDKKGKITSRHLKDEANTIHTSSGSGGNTDQFVIEALAGRIIGRNPENPKSRVAGLPTEQMLEVNDNPDITNTITTVQKDNYIIETISNQEGSTKETHVYKITCGCGQTYVGILSDLCPTCHEIRSGYTNELTNTEYTSYLNSIFRNQDIRSTNEYLGPKIFRHPLSKKTPKDLSVIENISVYQEPKLIIEHILSGGKWDKMNESIRRVYSSSGLAPTVTASQGGHHEPKTITSNRIRRLTPLECFRLQNFPDSFKKPCSDSQSYRQAGNSITVSVIQSILERILISFKPTN